MIDKEADYLFAEAFWRVSDFESLNDWLKLIADDLPDFHSAACRHPGWAIVRAKYGINPIDPENKDELVPYRPRLTVADLARYLKLKAEDISPLLTSVEAVWNEFLTKRPDKPERKGPKGPPGLIDATKVSEALNALLQYGFTESIFAVPGRDQLQRSVEILWMADRVTELHRMFEETMAKALARQAILNEMFMRRCDDQMTITPTRSKDFWGIQDTKLKIEAMYQRQWAQLEVICPFIKAAVGRVTVAGLISEFIESVKLARNKRKLELVDGLYDAYGIQVDLRTSVQDPVPRYRPAIVAMVNEARKGLWDPHWTCPLNSKDFRYMDLIFRTGYERLVDDGRIKQVDLEADGPEGEYAPVTDELPELPPETIPLHDASTGNSPKAQHPRTIDTEAPQAV